MQVMFEKMPAFLLKLFLQEVCGSGGTVAGYFLSAMGKKSVHLEANASICGGCARARI